MKITENKLSESKIELLIELERTDIEQDLQAASKRISDTIEIPGFRKGLAPYDVLCRHIGGEMKIYEEAIEHIVNRTAIKALQEKKYETFGKPNVSIQKTVPPFGVSYKIAISLMPKIELGDTSKIKVQKNEPAVSEDETQKVINNLLEMRATESQTDRAAAKGDKVILDLEIKRAAVIIENGKTNDFPLILGEGKFIPGFEDNVIGMKTGEHKKFELEFPKEYYEKSVAGKRAEFNVKLKQIFERKLPDFNDEFVKSMGDYKSADDFKKKVQENLRFEKSREEQERYQMKVMDELVKVSKVGELSEDVVHEEVHKMIAELEQSTTQQGMKFDDYLKSIKKSKQDLEKDFEPKAKERLKIMLVAREFGKLENVKVTEEEIKKEIEISKKAYQNQPELLPRFESEDYKNYMRNALTSKKIFETLVQKISS